MAFFTAPDGELGFGDLFDAEWLYAAYLLLDDAGPLRSIDAKRHDVAFAPTKRSGVEEWLLAHGCRFRALLVTDDCYVETVMGRAGGPSSGRLQFVPVTAAGGPEEMDHQSFKRVPMPSGEVYLPPDAFPHGGIAELAWVFSLKIRNDLDRQALRDARVASPSAEGRTEILARWNAHAVRRGPLVATDAQAKLFSMVTEAGIDPAQAEAAAAALGKLLAFIWQFEAAAEDRISEAKEVGGDAADLLEEIDGGLARLLEAGNAAADAVRVALGTGP